ncbi:patatin-like phospholipase family protein [Streptomyces chartreusis]
MSTALVLGGGGPVGVAWELGLLSGLDLPRCELVIGTASGSIAGAWYAAGGADDVVGTLSKLAHMLMPPPGSGIGLEVLDALAATAGATDPRVPSRALGTLAAEADTASAEEVVTLFQSLVGGDWPETFACTATDAESGDIRIFDASSGVSLARAVAASCALPLVLPVIGINGRYYMDGGMHDPLNAAFAGGHDLVIAISCLPYRDLDSERVHPTTRAQQANVAPALAELRAAGSRVEAIEPNEEFRILSADGQRLLDASRIGDAYAAGARLGADLHGTF